MTDVKLSKGSHKVHESEHCVMEYIALRNGYGLTDKPPCTHDAITRAAWNVNDFSSDAERQLLLGYVDRLEKARPFSMSGSDDRLREFLLREATRLNEMAMGMVDDYWKSMYSAAEYTPPPQIMAGDAHTALTQITMVEQRYAKRLIGDAAVFLARGYMALGSYRGREFLGRLLDEHERICGLERDQARAAFATFNTLSAPSFMGYPVATAFVESKVASE